MIGTQPECTACVSVTNAVQVSERETAHLMETISLLSLLGGCGVLVWRWWLLPLA